MRLGVDSYALRWQCWDPFQLLDYASGLGLDIVFYTDPRIFASFDTEYLTSLRQRAEKLGLAIEVGMRSIDRYSALFLPEFGSGEEQLRQIIDVARVLGAPLARCYLGNQLDRIGSVPFAVHLAECQRVIRAVAPMARELGIKIAVENHGGVDFLARELRAFVERAGPDVVGVCLDTGNPVYAGEDPLVTTEVLAPYIVTTQIRDCRVWTVAGGAKAQWVPVGQGNVDLRAIVEILASVSPEPPFNLEIITGEEPYQVPYLEPDSDFWRMYPDLLARDLLRFVALAERGTPEPLPQLIAPADWSGLTPGEADALRAQQRCHFEESVIAARALFTTSVRGSR